MGRDYKVVKTTKKGEIIYDEGQYTYVPKEYVPYQYKTSKSLKNLIKKLKNGEMID